MSIASEITRIKGKVADSFTACGAKGATIPESEVIANLPTCIDSIPTGSQAVLGTKSITANGTYNAVDDSLDGYSAVTVDVPTGGDEPSPTDGKTHAHISLRPTTNKAVTLYLYRIDAGTLYVDWGDNTAQFTSTVTGALNTGVHTYADYGDYEIAIWLSSGILRFYNGVNAAWISPAGVLTRMYYGSSTQLNADYALYGCRSVEYIDASLVASGSIKLGVRAFSNTHKLKNFILPDGLTSLGGYSLDSSYTIPSLLIPSSVATLGPNDLGYCYSLEKVIFNSTTPPAMSNINAFSGINVQCKIYVPDENVTAYKTATNWATYANYIYPMSEKE